MLKVIQSNTGGSLDFNRTWEEYKQGFGDPSGEFWIGNERLHQLTDGGYNKLRVELVIVDGKKGFAEYNQFYVFDEASEYALELDSYVPTSVPGKYCLHILYFNYYLWNYHTNKNIDDRCCSIVLVLAVPQKLLQ